MEEDEVKKEFDSDGLIPQEFQNPQGQGIFAQENARTGKWTDQQNLKYVVFLDYYKGNLASKQKRRSYGVFVQMAKFIASRSPVQCRSHHQKLEQKFRKFRKIISCFKREMGKNIYKEKYQELISQNSELLEEEDFSSRSQSEPEGIEAEVQTDITCFDPKTWDMVNVSPQNVQMQQMMYYPFCWPQNFNPYSSK